MEIFLEDVAAVDAFIADENAVEGVRNAVAETVDVSPDAVTVVLSKRVRVTTTTTTTTPARRLQGSTSSTRRLQETATEYYVHVESTIAVADDTAATALATRVEAIETDTFADTLTEKLEAADVASAALTGLGVGTVSAPTTAVIPTPAPSPQPSGTASGAIMTCQTSNLAALFTASAWLASFSCLS
jgi:hypothetical protein